MQVLLPLISGFGDMASKDPKGLEVVVDQDSDLPITISVSDLGEALRKEVGAWQDFKSEIEGKIASDPEVRNAWNNVGGKFQDMIETFEDALKGFEHIDNAIRLSAIEKEKRFSKLCNAISRQVRADQLIFAHA